MRSSPHTVRNSINQSSAWSRRTDLKCKSLAVNLKITITITKAYQIHDSTVMLVMVDGPACNQRLGKSTRD